MSKQLSYPHQLVVEETADLMRKYIDKIKVESSAYNTSPPQSKVVLSLSWLNDGKFWDKIVNVTLSRHGGKLYTTIEVDRQEIMLLEGEDSPVYSTFYQILVDHNQLKQDRVARHMLLRLRMLSR